MKKFAVVLAVIGMVMLFASYGFGWWAWAPYAGWGASSSSSSGYWPASSSSSGFWPGYAVRGVRGARVAWGGWGSSSSSSGYWPAYGSSSSSGYWPMSSSSSGWR